ncbi:MAG: hypothetical protein LBB48_05590 [Treponema sp.]|jgi:hypothetical protein|nr:hypothetical protein [Treponema sp.]
MTRKQSLTFRIILFLFGAGVVALAFVLNTSGKVLTNAAIFTWISIGIMYLMFFIPIFFSTINIANFSGKIPSLSVMWTGIASYIIASSIVIILLSNAVISLNKAVTGQAALLFLFAICAFLAFFASSHARDVGEEEKKKTQFSTGLKARAQILSLSVNSLPAEYEAAKTIIARALEEIKYLSPVDGFEGFDLEYKIMDSLNSISDICDITVGIAVPMGTTGSLETEARMLQMLVKERKLLRN